MARIYDNGIYRDATEKELKDFLVKEPALEIMQCKERLAESDYKCWKFAEGEMSAEEYEPIRLERRALRARINELEKELGA